jgi:hypothetical protein
MLVIDVLGREITVVSECRYAMLRKFFLHHGCECMGILKGFLMVTAIMKRAMLGFFVMGLACICIMKVLEALDIDLYGGLSYTAGYNRLGGTPGPSIIASLSYSGSCSR